MASFLALQKILSLGYSCITCIGSEILSGCGITALRTLRVRKIRVQFSAPRQGFRKRCGPVVKWYNAAFALQRREFDSRQVHKRQKYLPCGRFSAFVEGGAMFCACKTASRGCGQNLRRQILSCSHRWKTEACFYNSKNSRVRVVEFFV